MEAEFLSNHENLRKFDDTRKLQCKSLLSLKTETDRDSFSLQINLSEVEVCYKSPCCLCGKSEPTPKTTTIAVTAESLANARIKVAAEKKAAADEAAAKLINEERIMAEKAAVEQKKVDDAAAKVLKNKQVQERKKAAEDMKRLEKLQKKSAEKRKRAEEANKVQADQEVLRKKLDDEKKAKKAANNVAAQEKRDDEAQMLKEMAAENKLVPNVRNTRAVASAAAAVARPFSLSGEVKGASVRASNGKEDLGECECHGHKVQTSQNAVQEEETTVSPCSHREFPSLPSSPRKPTRPLSHKGVLVAEIKQLIVGKVGKTVKAKTGISQHKPLFQKQKEKEKETTPKDSSSQTSLLGRQLSRREQQYLGFINQLDSPDVPSTPTSPDPNSSYTVVRGNGTVSLFVSSTVYDASGGGVSESSLMSMIDETCHGGGGGGGADRKSSQELAAEEAEWRDEAEQARMMVRHPSHIIVIAIIIIFIITHDHHHHHHHHHHHPHRYS